MTVVSSREFNQDSGKAKKAARHGPVFITDRGRPAHVLLSIEDYQRLVGREGGTIVDLIGLEHLAPDLPVIRLDDLYRPADLD